MPIWIHFRGEPLVSVLRHALRKEMLLYCSISDCKFCNLCLKNEHVFAALLPVFVILIWLVGQRIKEVGRDLIIYDAFCNAILLWETEMPSGHMSVRVFANYHSSSSF